MRKSKVNRETQRDRQRERDQQQSPREREKARRKLFRSKDSDNCLLGSADRKFAKFLAFGSEMFCISAQVLCIAILLVVCVSVCGIVRVFVLRSQDNLRLLCASRIAMTMRGAVEALEYSSSSRGQGSERNLQYAELPSRLSRMKGLLSASSIAKSVEAAVEAIRERTSWIREKSLQYAAFPSKPTKELRCCRHGTLCGTSWRRLLLASPHLACALRQAEKRGRHNNWLINALQVAAKRKLFSFRGKTLINVNLKSRQTTRHKRAPEVEAEAEAAKTATKLFITLTQANSGAAA